MDQKFKKWIVGKIAESFELQEDARTQFLFTLNQKPEKIKAFIADRIKKWCSEYAAETKNMFIPNPNDVDEIFTAVSECFANELAELSREGTKK